MWLESRPSLIYMYGLFKVGVKLNGILLGEKTAYFPLNF